MRAVETLQAAFRSVGATRVRVIRVARAPQVHTVYVLADPHATRALTNGTQTLAGTLGRGVRVRLASGLVAVEIERKAREPVHWTDMSVSGLSVQIGISTDARPVVLDLGSRDTWHAHIAGATGAGKTSLAFGVAAMLALANKPADLQMAIYDPNGNAPDPVARLAHLRWPVARSEPDGELLLCAIVDEMNRRYAGESPRVPVVCLLDEASELSQATLRKVVALARGAEIHVLCVTRILGQVELQRGVYSQLRARILGACAANDHTSSRMSIGSADGLLLLGDGDMIMAGHARLPVRFQAAFADKSDPLWRSPTWRELAGETPPAPPRRVLVESEDGRRARRQHPTEEQLALILENPTLGTNKLARMLGVSNDLAARWRKDHGRL